MKWIDSTIALWDLENDSGMLNGLIVVWEVFNVLEF